MTNLCTSKGIMIPNYIVNNETLKPIDKYIYSYMLYFGKLQSYNKKEVEYYTTIYELANNIGVDSRTIKASIERIRKEKLITIKDNTIKYGMTIKLFNNTESIQMEKVKAEQKVNINKALERKQHEQRLKAQHIRQRDVLDDFIDSLKLKNKN